MRYVGLLRAVNLGSTRTSADELGRTIGAALKGRDGFEVPTMIRTGPRLAVDSVALATDLAASTTSVSGRDELGSWARRPPDRPASRAWGTG